MTTITWNPSALKALRKLDKAIADRILRKLNDEVRNNVLRYLETLVGEKGYKIRVGEHRLFVDYDRQVDNLTIRAIRHRRNAYKNAVF